MPRPKPTAARVFHALGDDTRRAILERLTRGPSSASQIAPALAVTLAAVVQHLNVLEESGLIRSEKSGRTRTCRLHAAGFDAASHWLSARRSAWDRRFDRLGELLTRPEDP